jgi:radical SAM protein with 4Fe4S-binding SPASM domain
MEQKIKYYRPVWTCGQFNKRNRAAIYYNLIEGMSYYFEDESAEVIGELLSVGRNGELDIENLSHQLGIPIDVLNPFLNLLANNCLVTNRIFSEKEVAEYRLANKSKRILENKAFSGPYIDPNLTELDSAEIDYTTRVNGIMSVMFELTYRCSEQCIHCYNIGAAHDNKEISHRADRVELNLEDYKRIIDELLELGLFRVCLTGGDPFSKSIVWDIIDYLYQKDIAFDIFTNGQNLLGYEEKLANYYPKLIGISIYSAIPEIHDSITRVKGSLHKSLKVMDALSALAIPMNLKCCVIKKNYDSYQTVYDIAAKYNAVPQIEVNVTDSIEGNKYVSKFLRLDEKQYKNVMQDPQVSLYVGKDVLNLIGEPKNMSASACKAGRNTFCITPEGNLIPCCSFHLILGNLKNDSLVTILKNNKKLNWWLNLKLDSYEECGKHEYCSYCNLCPGMNFSEHDTPLKAAENSCYLAKIRYDLAIEIADKK